MFGRSKTEAQERAAQLAESAGREAADAEKFKAKAAKVRQSDKKAKYPDPVATREIARQHEVNQRISEQNARELRSAAAAIERASKRWF